MDRKPPQRVVALRGQHSRDVITQAELKELEQAQLAEWHASKRAGLLSENIKRRIADQQAGQEDGPLYYDEDLEMVRSQKKEGAG